MSLYREPDNFMSPGKDDRPLCTKPAIFKGVKKKFFLIALSLAYVGLRFFPPGEFASVHFSFQKCWQVSSQQSPEKLHAGREVAGRPLWFPSQRANPGLLGLPFNRKQTL